MLKYLVIQPLLFGWIPVLRKYGRTLRFFSFYPSIYSGKRKLGFRYYRFSTKEVPFHLCL